MNTVVDTSLCDAAQIRAAFDQARKQGLRAKDAAQSLGLSYDQLRAALRKYPHLLTKRSSNEG